MLGLLQGLTEFLPVSSSAHLILVPHLFGWTYLGKSFDVALHFGTLLALAATFREEVAACWRGCLEAGRGRGNPQARFAALVAVASLPVALTGFLLEDFIERQFSTLPILASMLVVWGALMQLADRARRPERSLAEFSWREALVVGTAQAAALIPGTSRSGSTLAAGRLLGLSRVEAARFSFFLSLPVVLGASLWKALKLIAQPPEWDLIGPALVGILVSAISGRWCLKYFLLYLQDNSLRPFFLYRILLAVILFATLHLKA